MKLPNGHLAIVHICKLQDYCLNSVHPRGRNKARVFASVGIHWSDAEELCDKIIEAAKTCEAELETANDYGQRYVVDFDLNHDDRVVRIRTSWIVRHGEDTPRLTPCYVL